MWIAESFPASVTYFISQRRAPSGAPLNPIVPTHRNDIRGTLQVLSGIELTLARSTSADTREGAFWLQHPIRPAPTRTDILPRCQAGMSWLLRYTSTGAGILDAGLRLQNRLAYAEARNGAKDAINATPRRFLPGYWGDFGGVGRQCAKLKMRPLSSGRANAARRGLPSAGNGKFWNWSLRTKVGGNASPSDESGATATVQCRNSVGAARYVEGE
ncbi:hypothetical protein C8R44DRAFT_735233 [Mycena epipterygia]|nr:hypothetical protein C8R44DRAFT_735233 [Mycena epipterygia]